MNVAQIESDRRLAHLREEHAQAMDMIRAEHVQAMDVAQFESDQRLRHSGEEHAQAMDKTRAEHDQALSEAHREHVQAMDAAQIESDRQLTQLREEYSQAMDKTSAEHAQTLENAETRSTTKSKIIASNLRVLHRSDADAEERINALCEMQSTATQQLSPELFPDNRRLDSTNTIMEEGLALAAGDSGALFLFDKHSGIYMFRAEDLDYMSVATYKLMLVFRGDLCLPERLRSITIWDGVAQTLDFVLDWTVEYLKEVVNKFED